MEKFKPYAFLILAGFFYTLGFPNILKVYIPIMPIIATAMITFYIFKADSTRQRLKYYFFYNTVINILSFYWITNTLREFGSLPFIVAAAMNACFALIFNPQYLILIALMAFISKYKIETVESYFKTGFFNVLLAVIFTSLEYFIPQQFPVMLGQPWIVLSEYLGAARFIGLPIFSFMSYLLAFELVRIIKMKRASFLNLLSVLTFVCINPFLVQTNNTQGDHEFNVRLVQANISNFLKTESEKGGYASVSEVLDRYKELSEKDFPEKKKINLIVWPETAYPYPINTNLINLSATPIPILFSDIIFKTKAAMLVGGYDHFKENPDNSYYQTDYNSAFLLNDSAQLEEVYHKHILIPFGETLPLGPMNKWASTILTEMAFFAEGSKFPVFETADNINFISTICYEILRPEFIREYLNSTTIKPHFMINLTNDSWYGNTVEPEQHLFLTRWRAIEFNLPILRSTNTGVSTYIDRNGQENRRLAYDQSGNLDLSLKLHKDNSKVGPTFYQVFGFWAILPIWLLFFIFHIILIRLKYD